MQDATPDAVPLVAGRDLDQPDEHVVLMMFDGEPTNIDAVNDDDLGGVDVEGALQVIALNIVVPTPHPFDVGAESVFMQDEKELDIPVVRRTQRDGNHGSQPPHVERRLHGGTIAGLDEVGSSSAIFGDSFYKLGVAVEKSCTIIGGIRSR